MQFEWDKNKNQFNQQKQWIQPIDALSSIEIFLKAALRVAFKNISGF